MSFPSSAAGLAAGVFLFVWFGFLSVNGGILSLKKQSYYFMTVS